MLHLPEKETIVWKDKNSHHSTEIAETGLSPTFGNNKLIPDEFETPKYPKLCSFLSVICGEHWNLSALLF